MVQYSRTYFLTSNAYKIMKVQGIENFAGYVDAYEAKAEKDPFYADEYKLTSIYLKTLQSYYRFTAGLHQNCKENVISKVEKAIEKKILTLEEKLTKQENLGSVKESVEVTVSAYDILGGHHTLEELLKNGEDFRMYLIVVKILVKNIHSVVDPTKMIGTISISDSFLFGQK